MQVLPDRGQSFRIIREDNLLYVDKTEYIYNIIRNKGCFFLSRPRRFGKSLLLNAMAELLKGDRGLFEGLWIGSSDYDFKRYPVVQFSMAGESGTPGELRSLIRGKLHAAAKPYGMPLFDGPPSAMLENLVRDLKAAAGERVAVLVDEYDAPIQSKIGSPAEAEKIRLVLHDFYSGLKTLADGDQLQILFVTGVTKFTQASIFSVFNILDDLTMNPSYNAVCGFTAAELEAILGEFLPDVLEHNKSLGFIPSSASEDDLKRMIKDYYDGYSWDGRNRVFNPFSLVKFLSAKEFKNFWYSTGTPTFLPEFIKNRPLEYVSSETYPLNEDNLNAVDVKELELAPLLFQTGYLTVKERVDSQNYMLTGPNLEVDRSLNNSLLTFLTGKKSAAVERLSSGIRTALERCDAAGLADGFSQILGWVTHQQHPALEGVKHAVIYSVLKSLHFNVKSEVSEADGTFDMEIFMGRGSVYVCEFKQEKFKKKRGESDEDAVGRLLALAREKARSQIIRKKYDKRLLKEFKTVKRIAVGIVGNTNVGAEIF